MVDICPNCGKPLEPGKKFCSRTCYYEFSKKKAKPCPMCGNPIPRGNNKFCSTECYEDHLKIKDAVKVEKLCPVCGNVVENPQSKYCSEKCYLSIHKAQSSFIHRRCTYCGDMYPVKRTDLTNYQKAFCCMNCLNTLKMYHNNLDIVNRVCLTCGTPFMGHPISNYCSIECDPNDEVAPNLPYDVCRWCGQPYTITLRDQRYCSELCFHASRINDYVKVYCEKCGYHSPMRVLKSDLSNLDGVFCSDKCRSKYKDYGFTARRVNCERCGLEFTTYQLGEHHYCCDECENPTLWKPYL